MKLKNKIKLKEFYFQILGLLTLGIILGFAIWKNKAVETSITILLFFIYRRLFEKQYHASSLYLCSLISIIVFIVVIKLETNITISVLTSVMLTFVITLISYYVRDYFDNKILIKRYKEKLEAFSDKCLENLTEDEMIQRMPKVRYEIIHIVYGYLHRGTQNASLYAYKNNISEATLYRYVKQVKNKYESLGIDS